MLNSNVQSSAANATRVPVVVISTQEKGRAGEGARLSTHPYPYASGPPLSAAAGGITSDVAARRRATAQHRTAPPPRGFKPDFPLCACIASPKNPLVPGGAQPGVVSGLGAELRAHEDWTRKYLHLSLSFTTDQRPEVRRGRNGGRRPERSFQDYVQLLGRGTADPGGTAMSGRSVTILLVVWLAWASLLVPSTEALPNHVVAGGLFGPGGRVDPGALNPANSAGLVLYSTGQPSHPLVGGRGAPPPRSASAGTPSRRPTERTPRSGPRTSGLRGTGWTGTSSLACWKPCAVWGDGPTSITRPRSKGFSARGQ